MSAYVGPDPAALTPLQLVKYEAQSQYGFLGSHTYAAPGTYYGTVWVNDPLGGSDSETFVITVRRLAQTIDFGPLPLQAYGAGPLAISATGGASGLPVTFAVTGSSSVCARSGATSSGAGGRATATLLSAGTCIITAQQNGNDGYDAARAVTQSFDIQPVPLSITASNGKVTFGAPLPAITPGYEAFVKGDGPSTLDQPPTCSTTATAGSDAGSYATNCGGAADPSYMFNYAAGTLTIEKAATTLALGSSSASAVTGQPVTFTASAAVRAPGAGHPGGTVEFRDGAATIGGGSAQPINASTNAATCTTSALGVGPHSVTASYAGDGNFTGSNTVSAITETVGKASTTTPAGTSVIGGSVTLTLLVAVVAPGAGTPTGMVTFFDGTSRLGTARLSVVNGKVQGTLNTSTLALGRHPLTATYGGNSDFTTSTSAVSTLDVNTDLSRYPRLPNGAYNLANLILKGAYLVDVSLAGASLNTVNLMDAVLTGADPTGATVVSSNLSVADLTNPSLEDVRLSNTTFKGATFTGTNLTGATVSNSTLKDATGLNTATLTGVVWTQTICRDATNTALNGGTCVGRW